MDPLDKFLDFINGEQLFVVEDQILLAVSGGKDSVFMARLFAQSNFQFAIAHCNFQLRGSVADEDAIFVKSLADELDVPFFSVCFDTEKVAQDRKISIQMAARDLRYEWLEEIRRSNSYTYIAIAHHQTDTIETMLINLVRGTGIAGLHGILAKRDHIIRPLLAFTGKEVADYIDFNRISYREDSSNKETKYARNKIRLEVLPVLRQINPALEATFSLSSTRFHSLEKFLDSQISDLRRTLFLEKEEGIFHIPINPLNSYLSDQYVLYELFKPFSFFESVLNDLVTSLNQQKTGKLFYSSTHQLLVDRGKLILRKIQLSVDNELHIENLPIEFVWKGKRFKVSYSTDTAISKDQSKVKIDEDSVILPLKVRSWRHGDFFIPFGLKGTKKVSDFLIDKKISLDEKDKVPLFVNSNDDIIWVAPLRIDERYKVNEKTKKVIIFEQL